MGQKERDRFRKELTKLRKIRGGETDEYLEQNKRTAEAEDKCSLIDRVIVRNSVD